MLCRCFSKVSEGLLALSYPSIACLSLTCSFTFKCNLLSPSPHRTPTSGSWAPECLKEQVQTHPCVLDPCPPLCLHEGQETSLGSTWLRGECQQW